MFRRLVLTCLLAFAQVAAAACDEPFAKPGPYAVSVLDEGWVDGARGRSLPVRIYIPADAAGGKHAAIVFAWAGRLAGRR